MRNGERNEVIQVFPGGPPGIVPESRQSQVIPAVSEPVRNPETGPEGAAVSGSRPAFRPGPWEAVPSARREHGAYAPVFTDGLWRVVEAGAPQYRTAVATVDAGSDHDAPTRKQAEYTARLIAAAPELLAGAEAVVATCPCDPDINPRWYAAWMSLRAAIAKARGEAARG